MTATIDYSTFKPDWWDGLGVSAELVRAGIENVINDAFGTGIPITQKASLVDAAYQNYQYQQAIKAAANAAQEASKYADLPNSPQYQNAIASIASNENIALQRLSQANQIMQNVELNSALVNNLGKIGNALGPALNAVQLGSAAISGDAYVAGQTAVSVLAGMALGNLAMSASARVLAGLVAAELLVTAPAWIPVVIGIGIGFAASKAWNWMWDNGAADYYGIKSGDEFSFAGIADVVRSLFDDAKNFIARKDPLTFDLNGDGLHTTGIAAVNPILFDHDGDGIKNATGWIAADDALLTLDKNGNGTIDNGRELFGDNTILNTGARAGQLAKDGFDALADLDSNADGKITAADTQYNNLRLWRDLNQDGISQSNELFTLASQNIISINVTSTANSQTLPNGNQIADIGTFTKTDGSTGAVGAVTGNLADVNLALDTFHRQFPNVLDTTSVANLPDMQGSGAVRDLREAATQSSTLQSILTQFCAATTRASQMALIDQLLDAWADTSGYAESYDARVENLEYNIGRIDSVPYLVRYQAFGSVQRTYKENPGLYGGSDGGTNFTYLGTDEDDASLTDSYRQLLADWTQKIHILESFNGSYFFGLPTSLTEGARGIIISSGGSGGYNSTITLGVPIEINFSQGQLDLLQQSYDVIKSSVYDALLLQTRFKPILDQINLVIDANGMSLDFSQVNATFEAKIGQNAALGMADLIDFNRTTKTMLADTSWQGYDLLETKLRTLPISPDLQAIYNEFHVTISNVSGNLIGTIQDDIFVTGAGADQVNGKAGNDIIYAGAGIDYIIGGAGNDILYGQDGSDEIHGDSGNDLIKGGAGNDNLVGGLGNDTYLFGLGDGQDNIYNNYSVGLGVIEADQIQLGAGLTAANVHLRREDYGNYNWLIIEIANTTDKLTISNYFDSDATTNSAVQSIRFADGTAWSVADVKAKLLTPTAGDDRITGYATNDNLSGADGNDYLVGGDGNDTLDGGTGRDLLNADAGNDTLIGGAERDHLVGGYGDDTYLFGNERLEDSIAEFSQNGVMNNDKIVFSTLLPNDIVLKQVRDILYIQLTGTSQSIMIQNFFYHEDTLDRKIEQIQFADGTMWNANEIKNNTIFEYGYLDRIYGTPNADSIIAGPADNTIYAMSGDDVIDGGNGNDTIYGGYGQNTYLFGIGSGNDQIFKDYYSNDKLKLVNLLPTDISIVRDKNNLNIIINSTNETVTIYNYFHRQNITLDFSNGEVWGVSKINSESNSNVYNFGPGDGFNSINGLNQINLESLNFSDIKLERNSSSLIIKIKNSNDSLVVADYFTSNYSINFQNNLAVWNKLDVTNLLLQSTNGDDSLYGGDNNDIITGGLGNDVLRGGGGADTYIFAKGYGHDLIFDGGYYGGNNNSLRFLDINANDVVLKNDHQDLLITVLETGDTLRLDQYFYGWQGNSGYLQNIAFANGSVWSQTDIGNSARRFTAGNDFYMGTTGDDVIDSGAGNDYINSDTGNDVYIFGRGYGNDVVENGDYTIGKNEILRLINLNPDDIHVTRSEEDLILSINDTSETITFKWAVYQSDYFQNAAINHIEFANGITWGAEDIQQRLNNLSNYNDYFIAGDGDNTINGGLGNDQLFGGLGNDTYEFDTGSGADVINDYNDYAINDFDTVKLNALNPTDVILQRDNLDLIIKSNLSSDTITVHNQFYQGLYEFVDGCEINQIVFANGTVWGKIDINNIVSTPTSGNDYLVGFKTDDIINGGDGNDVLDGEVGDDYLIGGNGSDVYRYNLRGYDTIYNYAEDFNTTTDIIEFYTDTVFDLNDINNLVASRKNNDLVFLSKNDLAAINTQLTVKDYFLSDAYKIDQLVFIYPDETEQTQRVIWNRADFELTLGINNTNITNNSPTVGTAIAAQTVLEDSVINFVIPTNAFADVDVGDVLHYSATLASGAVLPTWLSFNSATGTFTGTPVNADVGNISVKVTAIDVAGASANQSFSLAVQNTNDSPMAGTAIAAQTVLEDSAINFVIPSNAFADVDAGDVLSYSATLANGAALPSWLSFNASTHTFSGTPLNGDVGNIGVKVIATDTAGASADQSFSLTVQNTNDAPTVGVAIAAQTVLENSAINFIIPTNAFADVDEGDVLHYSATLANEAVLPTWLSFNNATGSFTGTPLNGDVGNLSVKVTATDVTGTSVNQTFNLTVQNTNDAPVVANSITAQTTLEDSVFNFTVPVNAFADVDVGDTLSYNATLADGSALPSWLIFNAATRAFSGTPLNGDVGNLSVKVTAIDVAGSSVNQTFNLTVQNTNDAPTVAVAIAAKTTLEDGVFSFTIPANAFADVDVGDVLHYSATLANGAVLPTWLSFNNTTGTFSGAPLNADVGNINVKVIATDVAGATASQNFNLTVQNTNDAPTLSVPLLDASTNESQAITYSIPANTFADVDVGDTLTYTATLANGAALPSWLTFNAATRTLTGTPLSTNTGTLDILVKATDSAGTLSQDNFLLTVNPLNRVLTGTTGNDSLVGGAGNDNINGAAGSDTMVGGLGNDTYTIDVLTDVISENLNAGVDLVNVAVTTANGTYIVAGNVENASLINTVAYNLTGNLLDNTLTGNAAANILDGGLGADTMLGGLGNDTYLVDNIADLVTETSTLATELDTVQASISYLLGANLEKLTLTGATAINGTGNALANTILGNSNNNILDGGVGVDSLTGGAGNDTYIIDLTATNALQDTITELAAGGTDTLILRGGAVAAVSTLTIGTEIDHLDASGTGTTLLNLTGNTLANMITGNAANNVLNGLAGNDTMIGGLGNDTYTMDVLTDVVAENLNEGTDLVNVAVATTGGTYSLAANVENATLTNTVAYSLTGNALDNLLIGNAAANTLNGSAGNDTMNGLAGNDTMIGGLGNDIYTIDVLTDVVTENLNEGTDLVNVAIAKASGTYTLAANLENATLTSTVAYNLFGNALNNLLIGNGANNILTGAAGTDILTGGLGADIFDFNALTESLVGTSRDIITDFSRVQTDKIDLSTIDANSTVANDQAFLSSILTSGAFTSIGQLRLVGDILSGNTDSNFATSEFEIQLTGVTTLAGTDFIM